MSTTSTTIADLASHLRDAEAGLADCLTELTGCQSTLSASSFATVMAAGTSYSTAPSEQDMYSQPLERFRNGNHTMHELFDMIPGYRHDPATFHRVNDLVTTLVHTEAHYFRYALHTDVVEHYNI